MGNICCSHQSAEIQSIHDKKRTLHPEMEEKAPQKTFVPYQESKKHLAGSTEFAYAGVIKNDSKTEKTASTDGEKPKRDLDQGIVIIDGATGSELDRRGVDCVLPYWSAGAMIHSPDVVREVHKHYLRCGAAAITTNTFNTTYRLLERAGVGKDAE